MWVSCLRNWLSNNRNRRHGYESPLHVSPVVCRQDAETGLRCVQNVHDGGDSQSDRGFNRYLVPFPGSDSSLTYRQATAPARASQPSPVCL